MCDPATMTAIAASSAAIASSVSSATAAAGAAIATGASAAGSAIASGAAALGSALGIGGGAAGGTAGGTAALALGAGAITDSALIATAGGSAGLTLAEGMGIASLVLGTASGGASGGMAAQQAKEQGTLINAAAKAEKRNINAQANQQSEATAQSNFEVAAAALAARGNVRAANLGDRSVRAISRAVGFQEGTDKVTIKRNQEIANQTASARLQGVDITKQGQKLQVGDPALIAGLGAVNAVAGGLNSGAGAYRAFSRFQIPTDGPNLAFV